MWAALGCLAHSSIAELAGLLWSIGLCGRGGEGVEFECRLFVVKGKRI